MKTLRQILASKNGPLATVSPDDPVFHALQVMSDANVGAVLVLEGERLVGIFSERDYARKVILRGKASKDTRALPPPADTRRGRKSRRYRFDR